MNDLCGKRTGPQKGPDRLAEARRGLTLLSYEGFEGLTSDLERKCLHPGVSFRIGWV